MSTIPTELKATLKAWFTGGMGPQNLSDVDVASQLSYTDQDMTSAGWSVCGEADITVRLLGEDELIGAKVESLKAELTKVRADAAARETAITQQINTLLAIGYAGEVTP